MKEVNRIINESGISKVKIAKYLGVSRQMLYNYLSLKSFNDLPKEEKTIEEFDFKHDDRNIETASDEELDKWLSEVLEEKAKEKQKEKRIIFNRQDKNWILE